MNSSMKSSGIEVSDLLMTYGKSGRPAVNKVSLTFPAGQCTVLLGPSGCGKTTVLRSIAGLLSPDSGRVSIGGRIAFDSGARVSVNPERRNLGMVFQSYALWPHLSVQDNVSYPLRARSVSKSAARRLAKEKLIWVGLEQMSERFIHELSGGQQQRVALARAMVGDPDAILFDEPLSNLDARLRERMRMDLLELRQGAPFTSIYVTHDQLEAMTLGDQVVILRDGEVEQVGTPREVYERPRTRFAADFMGIPNLVPGSVSAIVEGRIMVRTPIGVLPTLSWNSGWREGDECTVAVRSTAVDLVQGGGIGGENTGTVIRSVFQGATTVTLVRIGDFVLTSESLTDQRLRPGDSVAIKQSTDSPFALLDD